MKCHHMGRHSGLHGSGAPAALSRIRRPGRILAPVLGIVLLAGLAGPARGQGCPLPPEYTHAATVTVGDVLVTLAVGQNLYEVGDSITFRLSFENIGSTPQVLPNPSMINPLDMIVLLPARCDSLAETGCYEDGGWIYRYPGGWFFFGGPVTLNPGQCRITTVTWNGIPRTGGVTLPGLYTAHAGVYDLGDFLLPVGGARLMIQIGSTTGIPPLPVVSTSWGRLKARYP